MSLSFIPVIWLVITHKHLQTYNISYSIVTSVICLLCQIIEAVNHLFLPFQYEHDSLLLGGGGKMSKSTRHY